MNVHRPLCEQVSPPRKLMLVASAPRPRFVTTLEQTPFDAFPDAEPNSGVVISHIGEGTILGLLDIGVSPVLGTHTPSRSEHETTHAVRELGFRD